jgi:hypothetical protein
MRETTNRKCGMLLATVTGLALALPATVMAAPTPTLTWHLDETGATTTADDAVNNHDGTRAGNVTNGAAGVLGTAYSGFTSTTSNVRSAELSVNAFQQANFSFTAWVKNPDLTSGTAFIARGDDLRPNDGLDVPWQLWVDGDGAIKLGVQDWNGHNMTYTSAGMTWTDQWYQVALTEAFTQDNFGPFLRHEAFKVYVTPAGSTTVGTPVLDVVYTDASGGGLGNGGNLAVGAGAGGSFSNVPDGFFGGQIDEVNLWIGSTLSTDDLNSTLIASVPEPASLGLLGLACTGMLARRRSR